MLRPLLALLLLPTALMLPAQYEPPDSLVLFRAAMLLETEQDTAPAPPKDYLLIWKEECVGHDYLFTGRDGSSLADRRIHAGEPVAGSDGFLGLGGQIFYGDRYAYVWTSPQKGLARHTYWYYERVVR